jgi:hypothetical protein
MLTGLLMWLIVFLVALQTVYVTNDFMQSLWLSEAIVQVCHNIF